VSVIFIIKNNATFYRTAIYKAATYKTL